MKTIIIDDETYIEPLKIEEGDGTKKYYIDIPKKDRAIAKSMRKENKMILTWCKNKSKWCVEEEFLYLCKQWLVKEGQEPTNTNKQQGTDKLGRVIYYKDMAQKHIKDVFENSVAYEHMLRHIALFREMDLINISLVNLINPEAIFFATMEVWNKNNFIVQIGSKATPTLESSFVNTSEESCTKTIERNIKLYGSALIGKYVVNINKYKKDDKGKATYNIYLNDLKLGNTLRLLKEGITLAKVRKFVKDNILNIELDKTLAMNENGQSNSMLKVVIAAIILLLGLGIAAYFINKKYLFFPKLVFN